MKYLISFLLALVSKKKPTVEEVLGTFVKTANTLDALTEHHSAEIEQAGAKISELRDKQAAAAAELEAAAAAAKNIRAIIGQ